MILLNKRFLYRHKFIVKLTGKTAVEKTTNFVLYQITNISDNNICLWEAWVDKSELVELTNDQHL